MANTRFTDLILEKGLVSQEDLFQAREEAEKTGVFIEDALVKRGVKEDALLELKGEALGIPIQKLEGRHIPFDVLKNVPEESARHYKLVPLSFKDGILEIGMLDPADIEAREALQFIASKINQPFKIFLISRSDFNSILEDYKSLGGEVVKALGDLETALQEEALPEEAFKAETALVEEAPITKMVAVMLKHATEGHASDIHIEPTASKLKVRFRVDGVLYTSLTLPMKVHDAVASRIKILTNMLLDEKRRPQDGRFSARIGGRQIDFRVSTFPTLFGEKVAIRILDPETGLRSLGELGILERNLAIVRGQLKRPYGLILITGPTGSGKTTTLYAMLQELDREKNNVVSLEDPVEYNVENVNQSQVKPEIGYDFASGLRSIVRQDPDIIMVGEIRDKETAKLAIHAALTGHIVLSTLHTNSAIGVIPRLLDMGVDPFLIPSTLALAVGQRLVRTLCPDSRKALPVSGKVKEMLEKEMKDIPEEVKKTIKMPKEIYQPLSSAACPKGTKGRIGIYEFLYMTPELGDIILTSPTENAIIKEARRQGMVNMREDGILKVLSGVTGLEELLEVV